MTISKAIIFLSLFCYVCGTICAQEELQSESSDSPSAPGSDTASGADVWLDGELASRLSETEGGLFFMQRLTWEEARFAVRYQVLLERKRETTGVYTEVLRRNLDAGETFIDISVPAGEYRFMVYSFNILGLLDSQSDWEYFVVLQALQPSVVSFSPNAFYFDRLTPRNIVLEGENLVPEAEIYLESRNVLTETGEKFIINPAEILRNELGETARLIFSDEDLVAGIYDIVVLNPGGLVTRAGPFSIALAKPYDINLSLGYTPLGVIFGQKDYFLDHFIVPLSFSARVSYIHFKMDIGNLGAEVSPFWAKIATDKDGFKTSAHLVAVNLSALFQYWIIRRELSVNGRAGFGFAGIFNYTFTFETGETWDSINTAAFSLNLGASVQWMFYKQIFVEAGLDYIHVIHKEIPMGLIRFGLFGGYQF